MQTIRWYRLFALGALAVPVVARAQAPQPIVKEIATIPGVLAEYAVQMPNGHVVLFGADDSICAFDVATKQRTVIARGWDYDLVLSPQGDRIAYSRSAESGDDFVWSMPIDPTTGMATGPAQRVSMSAGDSPSFSPDGRWIAFDIWRPKAGDLAVIPATGGPERILARYEHTVGETDWSPDSKWIYVEVGVARDTSRSIERVPVAGGRSEQLFSYTHLSSSEGTIGGQIAFFRETSAAQAQGRIAYITASGDRGVFNVPPGATADFSLRSPLTLLTATTRPTALHVLSLANGRVRDLSVEHIVPGSVRWSRDGSRVAALVADAARAPTAGIVVINADGTGERRYAAPTTGGIQWAPDGSMIAFGAVGFTKVGLLDLASGKTRVIDSPGITIGMHWQSDGKAIVLEARVRATPDAPQHIAILRLALDGQVRLLRDITVEFPDATRASIYDDRYAVVFSPLDSKDRYSIVRYDGTPGRVAIASGQSPTAILGVHTRSGNGIVGLFSATTPEPMLELFSVTGRLLRAISLPFKDIHSPISVLPDSQQVLLAGRRMSDTTLAFFVTSLNGGPARSYSVIPHGVASYFLSHDGTQLAFVTEGLPTSRIYAADLTTVIQVAGH